MVLLVAGSGASTFVWRPAEDRLNKRDTARARKTTQRRPGNSLLAALPHVEYQRLLAGLEPVTLKFGEVLKEPGMLIRHVYFPVDCVVSLLTLVEGHKALQVGLVGNEGMVGMPLALGIHVSSHRALVQVAGTALRMKSSAFRKEFLQSKPLQQALYRYKHALTGQLSQSIACNRFHSLRARFARYLLMTADRARTREIRLTHEFLARMLGVRRPGVTRAAGDLEKRKLIQCGRGKIAILDRKRLGASSCACYRIIKRLYKKARTRMADSARKRKRGMGGTSTA
ncbi:MAG: Crp/Fnr family transcriptional regulator [Burkholderiales bacterium]